MKGMPFQKMVSKINFSSFSGKQFERLCFAYFHKIMPRCKFSWLGESGKDKGRDLWGEDKKNKTICVQCNNHKRMSFRKAKDDIEKLVSFGNIPQKLFVICGGVISNNVRDKIKDIAYSFGIKEVEVKSGTEFEENLRSKAEVLLRRFVYGEVFPDDPKKISYFVDNNSPIFLTVTEADLNEVEITLYSINKNPIRIKRILIKKEESIFCPLLDHNCWVFTPLRGIIKEIPCYSVSFNEHNIYEIPKNYEIKEEETIYFSLCFNEKHCIFYRFRIHIDWIDIVTKKNSENSSYFDLIYHDKGKGTYCSAIIDCRKYGKDWIVNFDILNAKKRQLDLYSNAKTSQGFWKRGENKFSKDVESKFKGYQIKIAD